MNPYPAYRPSGVEWLGDVPEHWEVGRLKWSRAGMINGVWGEDPDGEHDIPCVRVADFDRQQFRVNFSEPTERAISRSQRSGRELRVGDLLLEKSGGGEKQMVGCVVLFDHQEPAVCSNFVSRVQVAVGQDSRFWTYSHAALYSGRLNYPAIKQTTGIQNLDAAAYFDTRVAFPPLGEQREIAAFLDRETERIDTLVAKKRLLVERLQEYRTALITRTVTRGLPPEAARAAGLDPSPRLKPSGVEWLGDVPEHWEVLRLRDCSRIQTGPFGSQLHADEYVVGGVPVINPSNLMAGCLAPSDEDTIPPEKADELRRHALAVGDIAFGRRGEMARAALVLKDDLPALCGTGCLRVSPDRQRAEPAFLLRSLGLDELRRWLELVAVGSTLANLNEQIVGRIPVALPPLSEQRAVVEHLGESLREVDRLEGKVGEAIERLLEYRTAITTAAVTGKIDVRESATTSEGSGE